MILISWNVNGIRAIAKKGFHDIIANLNPDILCLQETKAQVEQVREVVFDMNYHIYANHATKKGYSGTAILSKEEAINVIYDIGIALHDDEGRIIAAEYKDYYVVTGYIPNSKADLSRLEERQQWDKDLFDYLKMLEKKKPVLFCGDLNVAHKEIDLFHPKANYNKSAGFTQAEIDGMDRYVNGGFMDTWREMHPEEKKYSWWSYRAGARSKNVGWRIDYVLASKVLMPQIKHSFILNEVEGSDHCPVGIELE